MKGNGDRWNGGTPGYLVDDKLSYKADIWAMGVTIYVYYLGGRQLFKTAKRSRKNASRNGEDPEKWIRRLWDSLDGAGLHPKDKIHIKGQLKLLYTLYDGHLLNLLCDMLRANPENRLGFDDLVHYPFFSEGTDSVEGVPVTPEGTSWVDEEPLTAEGATKYKESYGIYPPR